MKLDGILPYARVLLNKVIDEKSIVIDATCGNGNDTLYLANLVTNGHVYAFDIQDQAINNTKNKLKENNINNVTVIKDSHANVKNYIDKNEVSAAIFNLGYLPGSDKTITTTATSTIEAINNISNILTKEGIIVLVVYSGHESGKVESNELLDYVYNLEQKKYHVLKYEFVNQKNNPPYIIAIEKRG